MKSLHGPVALFWNTTSCSRFGARVKGQVQAGGVAWPKGIKAGTMEQLHLVREGGMADIEPVTPVLSHVYKAGDFLSPANLGPSKKPAGLHVGCS